MSEVVGIYNNPELATRRLLTEPYHFLEYMDEYGNVPDAIFDAVVQNRATGSCEISIPGAITVTLHDVTQEEKEDGTQEQTIWWMEKTEEEVALSGLKYHFSRPARERVVRAEVPAARFHQKRLRPGVALPFVSPAMTEYDAATGVTDGGDPIALAKAEHLYGDDSIRVSTAVADADGRVVKRKLMSLLVRDVPFSAWVDMFKDPNNLFGKAFTLRDEQSALSVMEQFAEMELPDDKLPEGPVTLVAQVLPYITDETAHGSVAKQLQEFRQNQELYAREAERAGREWAQFDLELARSIKFGKATDSIRFFIMHNGQSWNDESLEILRAHQLGNAHYEMDEQLAALLARAKQKRLGDNLCVVVNNQAATASVSDADRAQIKKIHEQLGAAHQQGASLEYIRQLEARRMALLQRQNIRSGGGCPGEVADSFEYRDAMVGELGVGENANPFEDRSKWKWKRGVCQVKFCPSPRPTEVGPCSVCKRCQGEFDAGRDPTRPIAGVTIVKRTQPDFSIFKSENLKRKEHAADQVRGKYVTKTIGR